MIQSVLSWFVSVIKTGNPAAQETTQAPLFLPDKSSSAGEWAALNSEPFEEEAMRSTERGAWWRWRDRSGGSPVFSKSRSGRSVKKTPELLLHRSQLVRISRHDLISHPVQHGWCCSWGEIKEMIPGPTSLGVNWNTWTHRDTPGHTGTGTRLHETRPPSCVSLGFVSQREASFSSQVWPSCDRPVTPDTPEPRRPALSTHSYTEMCVWASGDRTRAVHIVPSTPGVRRSNSGDRDLSFTGGLFSCWRNRRTDPQRVLSRDHPALHPTHSMETQAVRMRSLASLNWLLLYRSRVFPQVANRGRGVLTHTTPRVVITQLSTFPQSALELQIRVSFVHKCFIKVHSEPQL